MNEKQRVQHDLDNERQALLEQLQDWLEAPMVILAFIWLALFVIEVLWDLNPLLETIGYVIWALFAVEFLVGLILAPAKRRYLKFNLLKRNRFACTCPARASGSKGAATVARRGNEQGLAAASARKLAQSWHARPWSEHGTTWFWLCPPAYAHRHAGWGRRNVCVREQPRERAGHRGLQ